MEDEIKYMKGHPPRCLENKTSVPDIDLTSYLQGQLGEESSYFSPKCACGNTVFKTVKPVESGVTNITCSRCGEARILFDPSKHGYDGELGHNDDLEFGSSEDFLCSSCGNAKGEVAIGFQYSGETDILEEEDAPDIQPEDLFSWVLIITKCNKCDLIQEVTQSECA